MQMLQTCVSLKAHVLGFLFSLPAQPQSSLSKGNLIALPRKSNRLQPRDAPSENENCSAVACGARASRPGKGGGFLGRLLGKLAPAPQASPAQPRGRPLGPPLRLPSLSPQLSARPGLPGHLLQTRMLPRGRSSRRPRPRARARPRPAVSLCIFPLLSAPPVMALLARFGTCVCSSCRTLGSMQRGALSQCFRSQGLPGPPSASGTRMRGNRSPLGG